MLCSNKQELLRRDCQFIHVKYFVYTKIIPKTVNKIMQKNEYEIAKADTDKIQVDCQNEHWTKLRVGRSGMDTMYIMLHLTVMYTSLQKLQAHNGLRTMRSVTNKTPV